MSKKIMLLALVAVSAAMFALPAIASAGVWDAETAEGGNSPGAFSGTGGTAELNTTSGLRVHCTSVTVTGSYDAGSKTTGSVSFLFHGCTGPLGVSCASSGQPSGTIATTALTFHNIHLESNKTKPGILITPNGTHFATFVCFGVETVVSGNGIVGEVTKPACGSSSTEATLAFARGATAGHQKWNQITTTGTVYDLTASGSTGSMDGSGTIKFAQSTKVNCT